MRLEVVLVAALHLGVSPKPSNGAAAPLSLSHLLLLLLGLVPALEAHQGVRLAASLAAADRRRRRQQQEPVGARRHLQHWGRLAGSGLALAVQQQGMMLPLMVQVEVAVQQQQQA